MLAPLSLQAPPSPLRTVICGLYCLELGDRELMICDVLCRTLYKWVELCQSVSNRVVPCRTVSNRVVPCRTVSNRDVLCRTVSLQARDKQKHGLMRTVSGSTRPDSVGKLATRLITLINSLPADSEASQLSTLLASLTSSLNQQGAQVTAAAAAFAARIASSTACFLAAKLAASSSAWPQLLALLPNPNPNPPHLLLLSC